MPNKFNVGGCCCGHPNYRYVFDGRINVFDGYPRRCGMRAGNQFWLLSVNVCGWGQKPPRDYDEHPARPAPDMDPYRYYLMKSQVYDQGHRMTAQRVYTADGCSVTVEAEPATPHVDGFGYVRWQVTRLAIEWGRGAAEIVKNAGVADVDAVFGAYRCCYKFRSSFRVAPFESFTGSSGVPMDCFRVEDSCFMPFAFGRGHTFGGGGLPHGLGHQSRALRRGSTPSAVRIVASNPPSGCDCVVTTFTAPYVPVAPRLADPGAYAGYADNYFLAPHYATPATAEWRLANCCEVVGSHPPAGHGCAASAGFDGLGFISEPCSPPTCGGTVAGVASPPCYGGVNFVLPPGVWTDPLGAQGGPWSPCDPYQRPSGLAVSEL